MASRSIRLAVLCSFNLDLIKGPLTAEIERRGIACELYFSGYGQWESDALDPNSGLHRFHPTVVIVFAEMADLVPPLSPQKQEFAVADSERLAASDWRRVEQVVARLLEATECDVLVHSLVPRPVTSLGPLEGNDGLSYAAIAEQFNRMLRERGAGEPRLVLFDYADLVVEHGWHAWHDERLWYLGRMRLAREALGHLAVRYARYLAAMYTPRRKCLMLDLDNTLWGGIIGEDGMEGIALGHEGVGLAFREFQMAALALSGRGVILAICSKNNPGDALEVLEKHPDMVLRPDDFAAMEIGWDPKPAAIRRLAERLNIGVNSLVFWDDNPRERAAVQDALPEVFVPDVPEEVAEYASALLDLECFDRVSLTDEDRRRGEMYRQQRLRDESQAEVASDDLDGYYHSLKIRATLRRPDDVVLRRIAQLTERTNQFNFTTRRYDESDIRRMQQDPDWRVYGLAASDRFGDLGLIGAALVETKNASWEIDTLLLSCRALGRGIEQALLGILNAQAHAAGARLCGDFITTEKNAPARQFLDRTSITLEPTEDASTFRFEVGAGDVAVPAWVQVNEEPDSA